MDIFEALRADHDEQRRLIDQLADTHGASDDRNRLFGQLKVELAAHAGAEERYFYVPLMQALVNRALTPGRRRLSRRACDDGSSPRRTRLPPSARPQ